MKIHNVIKNTLFTTSLIFTTLFTNNSLANEVTVPIDSWPPFRMVKEKSNEGIDFDLLAEIQKRTDFKFNYIKYPWSRSLASMKNGKVDLMSGLAKREERAKYIQYTSIPYYTCSTVFYVPKGNREFIRTYEDLKGFLIGYVDASAYFPRFDNDTDLLKRGVTSESQLLRMLVTGRIKVMIGTDCQVDYDIKRLGYSGQFEKAIYRPNNKVDLYIGVSKKSALISEIDTLNNTIKDIVDEGVIKKIVSKYYD